MAEDFTDLYVFNLRGNQRTAGEQSRKEGGKVFGSGSRNTVAITIGVKDPKKCGFTLFYRDIGDYLTAVEKLEIVRTETIDHLEWKSITPNKEGDWLNQRSDQFALWPVVGEKKESAVPKIFDSHSLGLATNRDAWVYNFSGKLVVENVELLASTYHQALSALRIGESPAELLERVPAYSDPASIKWALGLTNRLKARRSLELNGEVIEAQYRPFQKQKVFFDEDLNNTRGRLPSMFPTVASKNIGFYLVNPGNEKLFSLVGIEFLPDLAFFGSGGGQFFPRFTWAAVSADDGGLFGEGSVAKQGEASIYGKVGEVVDGYVRVDNITDEIKALYRDALGADITGDDIFHFVYGMLHDPGYRTKYAADLKKMLPHIETPSSRAEFDKFAAAGKELMDLHVGYESVEPWPLDIQVKGDESDRETWRVTKMRWAKRKDAETGKNVDDVTNLIYNKQVTISGIPAEADEYMLGSRSAVAWLIDRYQVKKDKASGIVNDPNDWADEVGNPRYIVELIGRVVRVAMETVRIVDGLNAESND